MITLIIARHGNTFNPGDVVTRVGARTDLPLTKSGEEQARLLGRYLQKENLIPDEVYVSCLQRTQQTAKLALEEMDLKRDLVTLKMLNEIDYGPDENKPEDEVISRIGKKAIEDWDKHSIPPDGWLVDPDKIIRDWKNFATNLTDSSKNPKRIVLVLTSNGVGRFAPQIASNCDEFVQRAPIKLSTGSLGIIDFSDRSWHIRSWNLKPENFF
ncbi:MAG: histidine phosphatase family protein [Alphaproteobacteria bacterium]|nr:histidine phosphatase family protein [Alphaproteobacteria bacterium]